MNKTAIKNYAVWARVQLIESAKQRAFEYAITDGENDLNLEIINGRILSSEEKNQRAELISLIKQKGFEQVMEEAAYTWFNRFIALRFMEVNGYLPSKVRVFTDENNEFKPQILKEAMTIELDRIDRDKILSLIEKQDNEELFKYLVIAQCNALSFGLPGMFETISNWTELLFPANLLKADSVIGQMITNIPEEDWTDQVQIIGWLYQYYNSELKDDTFAKLKKNIKITKERIPAATQLFTPDWIVRYMVENSLGRLWYEGHPDFDKSEWKYYLDEAKQEPEVEEELKKIRAEYAQIKPEEIKVIDPCMGSGHILVYAFDVLMQIYTSAGWSDRDAAKSILENNLFGLDIDDRAGQLAYFAVMMKARKHNRRILNGEVRPKVLAIQESNGIDVDLNKLGPEKAIGEKLLKDLRDAKEYGSILNLKVTQKEIDALKLRLEDVDRMASYGSLLTQYESWRLVDCLYPLIEQAEIMTQKYDVVVTNPPYMGAGGMSAKLSNYVKDNYPDSKSDLFAVFIEKCVKSLKTNGYQAMITPQSLMFLNGFENHRRQLLFNNTITTMAYMGFGAFGTDFGTTSFTFIKRNIKNYIGTYKKLDGNRELSVKEDAFLKDITSLFNTKIDAVKIIPGMPLAFWIKETNVFMQKKLADKLISGGRIKTHDNTKYVRGWWEVCINSHWIPYANGGGYRKWYGNYYDVIDWSDQAITFYDSHGGLINQKFLNKEGITWNDFTSKSPCYRIKTADSVYSSVSPTVFNMNYYCDKNVLGFLNSKVGLWISELTNPTVHTLVGDVLKYPDLTDRCEASVKEAVEGNIEASKNDWDSFEISWDFKKHPLI